jgi:hypothetical protein
MKMQIKATNVDPITALIKQRYDKFKKKVYIVLKTKTHR